MKIYVDDVATEPQRRHFIMSDRTVVYRVILQTTLEAFVNVKEIFGACLVFVFTGITYSYYLLCYMTKLFRAYDNEFSFSFTSTIQVQRSFQNLHV